MVRVSGVRGGRGVRLSPRQAYPLPGFFAGRRNAVGDRYVEEPQEPQGTGYKGQAFYVENPLTRECSWAIGYRIRMGRLLAEEGAVEACYHCVTRVVERRFVFGEREKERFFQRREPQKKPSKKNHPTRTAILDEPSPLKFSV